ncbi:hypothetical protein [Stakelama tenebrarum]|uniref:Uncharacterized protein n=1 Tax=Stakelama tenebrarum TaxID=2711215 RepID=A0A6G6Y2Y3_9SPHN|nr:hypothetical protein [Sphingosinithalassobacter tenebrarum]QIG79167.1 hypothetical protein G5C33_04765 [Sphingosinithalassobacter tenebrarum]
MSGIGASTAAASAGVAAQKIERAILARFEDAEAFSGRKAILFEPQGRQEARIFARLRKARAIRDTGAGRHYFDRETYQNHLADRRRGGMLVAGAFIALAVIGVVVASAN